LTDDEDDLDLGRLLSAADAERYLRIKASTVRTWHQRRGQTGLYPAGLDSQRKPLFWEADLVALRERIRIRDAKGVRLVTSVPRPRIGGQGAIRQRIGGANLTDPGVK
jgi:hypothetical protein